MLGITILGNNSAIPAFGRHPTAQIVTVADELFLVDCGEGTQMRMSTFRVRQSRITHILISHLHGDHFYGLTGLINTMNLLNREQELHIHGPAPVESVINMHLALANTQLRFTIHYHTNPAEGGIIHQGAQVQISCFPVTHRIPCWGYRFDARTGRRKLLVEKAKSLGIPAEFYKKLVQGHDYENPATGACIRNEWVTEPGPVPPSYAFCADTLFNPAIAGYLQGVHTIYHESTFLESEADKAAIRFHSTARQAALLAKIAGVKCLLLGHFSSRYETLEPFLEEATPIFPNTLLAWEGTTFLVRPTAVSKPA